jgi:DNA invertase Pin-like site-specific DNA recombinase
MAKPKGIRCAVYTRKSSEEGLDQSFNSLHAQREACEAYILSQRHEGWSLIPTPYDDGGFSGGSMERPALKSLLADINAGMVDVVVVYKIDRLTRSLFDFAKIVETLDAHTVSFVSVTQSFNTTTSMGRLTLNVLLSFAQFEREVTGERIRDKFAASKKRGMWMGGNIPLGYDLKDRKLVVNKKEAETVTTIFRLYVDLGSVRKVKAEIDRLKLRTKLHTPESGVTRGGLPFRIGHLYTILRNHVYRGEIKHRGEVHSGDHEPVLDQVLWDKAQAQLASNVAIRRSGKSSKDPSLLAGLLFDGKGNRMTPSHTAKNGKRYRYYISNNLIAGANKSRISDPGEGLRFAAQEIEGHVITAIAMFLADAQKVMAELCPDDAAPDVVTIALRQARSLGEALKAASTPDRYELVRSLIVRAGIDAVSICVELRRACLIEKMGIPIDAVSRGIDTPIQLTMPAELRRLGKEKRLIVAAHMPKSNPDSALIKVVVRAHNWFEMLKNRKVESISELARAESVQRTYPSRIIPLVFLAPDITEAILEGRQPIDLSLDRLMAAMPLPLAWDEQRAALGFAAR